MTRYENNWVTMGTDNGKCEKLPPSYTSPPNIVNLGSIAVPNPADAGAAPKA